MIKKELKCFYTVARFEQHEQLKNSILEEIKFANAEHIVAPGGEVDITRTDWSEARNPNRFWTQLLVPHINKHMADIFSSVGYDTFRINEFWFQQYHQNSGHGWHVHGSNFTNVYYLELPDGAPKTQMVHPFDQTTIEEFDIKEGDILTFPSFVLHRAPPNLCGRQKTIISYNVDIDYPDSQYGRNLTGNIK